MHNKEDEQALAKSHYRDIVLRNIVDFETRNLLWQIREERKILNDLKQIPQILGERGANLNPLPQHQQQNAVNNTARAPLQQLRTDQHSRLQRQHNRGKNARTKFRIPPFSQECVIGPPAAPFRPCIGMQVPLPVQQKREPGLSTSYLASVDHRKTAQRRRASPGASTSYSASVVSRKTARQRRASPGEAPIASSKTAAEKQTALPSPSTSNSAPIASSETAVEQQRALPSSSTSDTALIDSSKTLAEQRRASPGLSTSNSALIASSETAAEQQRALPSSSASDTALTESSKTAAEQQRALPSLSTSNSAPIASSETGAEQQGALPGPPTSNSTLVYSSKTATGQRRALPSSSASNSALIDSSKTAAEQQGALPGLPTSNSALIDSSKTAAEQQGTLPGLPTSNSALIDSSKTAAEQQEALPGPPTSNSTLIDSSKTAAEQQKTLPGLSTSNSAPIASSETGAEQQRVLPGSTATSESSTGPRVKSVDPIAPRLYSSVLTGPAIKTRDMAREVWPIIDYVRDENCISTRVATRLVKLFESNNTIPFIARYMRGLTEGMNEEELRKARRTYDEAQLISNRALEILNNAKPVWQWTTDFNGIIHDAKSLHDLEYIHEIFTAPMSADAKSAAVNGLRSVAKRSLENRTPPLGDLLNLAVPGLQTKQQIIEGLIHLVADMITKDRSTFKIVREMCSTHPFEIRLRKNESGEIREFRYSLNWIQRDFTPDGMHDLGDIRNPEEITVVTASFKNMFYRKLQDKHGILGFKRSVKTMIINGAIGIAYHKVEPFVISKVRSSIIKKVAKMATGRLIEQLKEFLLAKPFRFRRVIGLCPGFENGGEFAVLSARGDVLETGTVDHNNLNDSKDTSEAERVLANMICKYECKAIALGDGIGYEETAEFLKKVLKTNQDIPRRLFYSVVDESSARINSRSAEAQSEFPNLFFSAPKILRAVYNGRRLLDPMAELVKIDAKHITEKEDEQELYRALLVEVVNYVGLDVNTASEALLKLIAGLNEETAQNIIEWRRSNGPFTNRNDLRRVPGINEETFKQCVGFLRIVPETAIALAGKEIPLSSFEYLDQTWIHPKDYSAARAFLEHAKCKIHELGTGHFMFSVNRYAKIGFSNLAQYCGADEKTMEIIVQAFRIKKGKDVRDSDVSYEPKKFKDLKYGQNLYGVVYQVNSTEAYVDVGTEIDGVIRKRDMKGVKLEIDDRVEVRVGQIKGPSQRLRLRLINRF